MLCDPFVSVLRAARPDFNAQFAQARREHPTLDDAAFSSFVRDTMDPLVRAVHAAEPNAVSEVVVAAWEAGLELVAQRLAGPQARSPWINRAWQEVLVPAARHVARAPRRVIGALSNAAHHLGTTPETRPAQWLAMMNKIATQAADDAALLKAGQVAAWRSGLAHYRTGALALALELPPDLALTALDAAGESWPALHAALLANPWHYPGRNTSAGEEVLRTGSFRGFGGIFTAPPRVAALHGQLLVSSGDDAWLLTADAFGATFHRAAPAEVAAGRTDHSTEVTLSVDMGAITSMARTETTLAVTGALTHAVLLFTPP